MNCKPIHSTDPRRIAILADFPWSYFKDGATGRGGGQAATWLTQLAEEFSKQSEFEIHWVTLDRDGSASDDHIRSWGGQHFHRITAGKVSIDLLLGYQLAKRGLLRALTSIGPDLVHCWGSERAYPVVCNLLPVPTVFSLQGILTHLSKLKLLPPIWQWRMMAAWERKFMRAATLLTTESSWGVDRVKEIFPEANVRKVEYGVNPSFYDVEWNPDDSRPYAIFVGTISHAKGADVLLKALSLVENRGWRLKVVGQGPLQSEFANGVIHGVEWLDNLRWSDLQRELSGARCLVLPTLADTSPNVVKEARVIGLPVVTTRHGGQNGYVFDEINGIIVDPLCAEGLAKALVRLMDDRDLAFQMGRARHEEDRAYFQSARTAKEFLNIYRELAGAGPGCVPVL